MRSRRRPLLDEEAGENFWPSFTDLISTISLILFVLVLLAYMQNLISGKNLERTRSDLKSTLERLEASQREIASSERRLRSLAAEIEAGQAQLKLSEEKVTAQQAVIGDSNRELEELRSRLHGISVLRVDLLTKVKNSLEAELQKAGGKTAPQLRIAENGNIVLNESLVFEYNSYTIKPEGKRLLDKLADAFARVLADPSVRSNIDVVLVQGHTDERGQPAYNRELSAKRANAVLDHMFAANRELEQSYGSYFASCAYSEFRPLNTEKSEQAYEQNRRIEISVVLKDATIRGVIDEYMRNVDPALRPGAPATP